MEFARHEAELNTPDKDGLTLRAIYEEKERKGEILPPEYRNPPECPEELAHLYTFAMELTGRSGGTQWGLAPLGYSTIRDWSYLTGWTIEPRDVDALIRLDTVLRSAGRKEETSKPKDAPIEIPAWPQKKEQVS